MVPKALKANVKPKTNFTALLYIMNCFCVDYVLRCVAHNQMPV